VSTTRTVRVDSPTDPYDVVIGSGLLARSGELIGEIAEPCEVALVVDDAVGSTYGTTVDTSLARAGFGVTAVAVPSGESSKNWALAGELLEGLASARLGRDSMLFALGGGVIGDLAGFVAATFLRGIDFAQIPTTLISQIDSSIGGKTGVNLARGKNLVGAFHHPRGVVIDTDVLRTLPERELRSGLAEVIKHAAIADAELFEYLEDNIDRILKLDPACMRYVIARNCQIKAEIVSADPFDRGIRAILNFGHTIGHALEKAAGEWQLRHGEGVAIGMVAETRLAARMGRCTRDTLDRLEALVRAAGLPTTAADVDCQRATVAMGLDKKIEHGRLKLSLVQALGQAQTLDGVDRDALEDALQSVCAPGA
jgi:3-dehydroquinate synthase